MTAQNTINFVSSHKLNYDVLLADQRLDVTIAQGYIEEIQQRENEKAKQLHEYNLDDLRNYFQQNGYTDLGKSGNVKQLFEKNQPVKYLNTEGQLVEKDILIRVTVISPNGQESLEAFTEAILGSEVLIYEGHGRRGLGPDFDAINIPDGNFLISLKSSLHAKGTVQAPGDRTYPKVSVQENKLEKLTVENRWGENIKYRIWFFNACNTRFYLDEFRSDLLPADLRASTDILLTQNLVSLYTGAATSLAFLDHLLKALPTEDLPSKLFHTQQDILLKSGIYDPKIIATYLPCYFWNFDNFVTKKSRPVTKKKRNG